MFALVFDTETTGLPLWREPSDNPGQPHIVDLSAELWDGDVLIENLDCVINPGVPIPPEMTAIHGITDEMAAQGMSKSDAVSAFMKMVAKADVIVGHNVSFDIRMMRIEAARVLGEKWEPVQPTFCTMRKSTNHCKIISERARHPEDWKWPKLGEAMKHFFDEDFADAHRAKPDCEAARRIYFHLMSMEKTQ